MSNDINMFGVVKTLTENPGILLPDKVIAFNRDFLCLGIGVKAALFLSQAVFWSRNRSTLEKGGWFYKTNKEWEEETGLTEKELVTVKDKLCFKGYLVVEKRGMPAKNHFFVKVDDIAADIVAHRINSGLITPQSDKSRQIVGTCADKTSVHSITKNTTKNSEAPASQSESDFIFEDDESVTRSSGFGKGKTKAPTADALKVFALFKGEKSGWGVNKIYRGSAQRLYENHGLEKIRLALKFFEENKDEQFCPQIHNPFDLEMKWDNLRSFRDKQ